MQSQIISWQKEVSEETEKLKGKENNIGAGQFEVMVVIDHDNCIITCQSLKYRYN